MKSSISNSTLNFLIREIGLDKETIDLGMKLSIRNKATLSISLWSYGLITTEELDKLYVHIFSSN